MSSFVDSLLANTVDTGVEAFLRLGRVLPGVDVLPQAMAPERRRLAEALGESYRPRVNAIEDAALRREPAALAELDRIAEEAMHEMRTSRPGGFFAAGAAVDRVLYKNQPEFLDDPDFPMEPRVHLLDRLDKLNHHLGSYTAWAELLRPLIDVAGHRGPVRIHDLASGHGGFAIALEQQLGAEVEVTASDVKEEYLDLGRARAAELGANVRFVYQDAMDLSNLEGQVDIFACTQSLHHFPPGMIARMLGEAARSARVGVCFIDGERGVIRLALISSLMAAYCRSWAGLHDTFVSLRRMPFAEELLLLARLAPNLPEGITVQAERRAPGYGYVMLSR